jgi:hypothetical protein
MVNEPKFYMEILIYTIYLFLKNLVMLFFTTYLKISTFMILVVDWLPAMWIRT